ncbi:hypothetical protein K1J35_23800 [Enterobacter kobei]|uniref:Uncharacterized protein n=1 Tax=Enterobacter kobei TaxID=208224 RepID=A0AAJ6IV47_9ENTR|nr:hypothetical protein [Enterobacter kobei]MBW7715597.1 hypothetical protein [Enterobacter kobei]MBW7723819.1 hypothetical protein [Enterobacter kobei]WMT64806.1 hypothetical protein M2B19_18080 [Enterobacter kobei]
MSELVKRGHDQAAELKSSCGAVDVRTVAQLISDLAAQLDVQLARSNALAAELNEIKVAVMARMKLHEEIRNAGRPPHTDFWHQSIYMADKRVNDSLSSTPNHDAFLAEVRAQGADECVRQLVISDDDDFSDAPNICAMVAHKLRKGVQS